MLGNDIIDISLTKEKTNWTRPGWLDKICNLEEQNVILLSKDPFQMAWRIWSMKESAYKINIRKGHRHAFNPTHFKTVIIDDIKGKVFFGDEVVDTNTAIHEEYIHTLASNEPVHLRSCNLEIISEPRSLKAALLEGISKAYSYSLDELEIHKTTERVPTIYHADCPLYFPVSMSHHGNYGAYVFYKHLEEI